MKSLITSLTCLMIGMLNIIPQKVQAQVPQQMSYQAILRDTTNHIVKSSVIGMQISILKGSATGTAVYVEKHTPTTSASGLISIEIGTGTAVSGVFSDIDWEHGPYFIKSESDPQGGSNYLLVGTSQLLSVPYALFAKKAESVCGTSVSATGDTLYISNGNWVIVPGISMANQIAGKVVNLECDSATNTGILTTGITANAVNSTIPYQGGDGGLHNGQTVNSTGVTGLTATLLAGSFANGTGTLDYSISGTPSGSGLASFAIAIGGKSCTLVRTVNLQTASITGLQCDFPTVTGSLFAGVSATGVSVSVSYTGGNGGYFAGQTTNSTGVSGLIATLSPDTLGVGNGSLTLQISGVPSINGTARFPFNFEGKSCEIKIRVNTLVGTISSLHCDSTTLSGVLIEGVSANGVSVTVPYTGGNGGTHSGQTVNSTGVTGLTATLSSGTFALGDSSLNYSISGIPNSAGIASFALNIGGDSCLLNISVVSSSNYPPGTVFCSLPTIVVDVTNPTTGAKWMDRNLGASQAASLNDSTEIDSFGDLYQWGRGSDGHQCRNSAVTTVLSSLDQPGHNSFISDQSSGGYQDWRTPHNANLWQGGSGVNNPCPIGYRIPTQAEWIAEMATWISANRQGAFSSVLKLPAAKWRLISGNLVISPYMGYYWSSTTLFDRSYGTHITMPTANVLPLERARGLSVRCIKDL